MALAQAVLAVGLALGAVAVCRAQHHDNHTEAEDNNGPSVLRRTPCQDLSDCRSIEGSFCDVDARVCACKQDYPITDSKHCYKESKYGEFCRLDVQCQRFDKNARCNIDLNVCQCQSSYLAQPAANAKDMWCVETTTTTNTSVGSYYDPTLFGIMGGLALMFVVMCVVLQLFAKAQFQENNRTIFNTPNPRLMNVSLMKDNERTKDRKLGEESRKKSVAAAAAAAAANSGAPAGTGPGTGSGSGVVVLEERALIEVRDSEA